MSSPPLSPALLRFLMVHVHSFEQLDVLLLLHRKLDSSIGAAQLSVDLGLDREHVLTAAAPLVAEGVLRQSEDGSYTFASFSSVAPIMEELAQSYAADRLSVVQAMSANAIVRVKTSAIKTFTEAFILRKPRKKDG